MKATEQLKAEHNGIKLMLRILDEMCRRLESGTQLNLEHLDSVVEFLKVFVDKCHHGKEEDLLFPAMEEVGVPREGGPIGAMLAEHNVGRDYVRRMSEAIVKYKSGDRKSSAEIVTNARQYMALLRSHIEKEDGVLYALADAHLLPEKQEELAERFETIERERIGVGRHEQFHKLMRQLEQLYLK